MQVLPVLLLLVIMTWDCHQQHSLGMIFVTFIHLCLLVSSATNYDDVWLSPMQCIHVFSCSFTIRVYPLSHFQLFLILVGSVKIIRNPLFIFYLDKLHPFDWRNHQCCSSYGSLLPFLSIPRVIVREPYIHEDTGRPFSYPAWEYSVLLLHFSADGALADGCLAFFPRLKGRTICIYSFFLTI